MWMMVVLLMTDLSLLGVVLSYDVSMILIFVLMRVPTLVW